LSSRDGEFAGSLPILASLVIMLAAEPVFTDRFPQDDLLAVMSL
jgi:hypothetical protein